MILLGTKKHEEGNSGMSAGQLGMILGARFTLLLGAVGLFVAAIFAPKGLSGIFAIAASLVFVGYLWIYLRTRRMIKLASKRSTQ